MSDLLLQRAREKLDQLRIELLQQRTDNGHWVGELSASALSTATAVSALSAVLLNAPSLPLKRVLTVSEKNGNSSESACSPKGQTPFQTQPPFQIEPSHRGRNPSSDFNQSRLEPFSGLATSMIRSGMTYLCSQQNSDGGFGDTDRSHSNIATSYLALAASKLAAQVLGQGLEPGSELRLKAYLEREGEIEGLRRRYGKDKTFVVPILTNMAIAGLVDWDLVPQLPFEAAVFPQSMYRFLRMPVVSYAIPALVAIGQARHFLGRKAIFPVRWIRNMSVSRTMRVLRKMQPESGGYLEATPLTSFVLMSLAVTGRADTDIGRDAIRFLSDSMREDGSWPIDTNLATWVTSLAIGALAKDPLDDGTWYSESLATWLLQCQHRERHPFTGAEPGGWGWTDLSGAVPDGDDTPAAMLAIRSLVSIEREISVRYHLPGTGPSGASHKWYRTLISRAPLKSNASSETGDKPSNTMREILRRAEEDGHRWLRQLQNRDGGFPTFCRGWGTLPFDRSSTDLTAHAIRAIGEDKIDRRVRFRAERFLSRAQQLDGSWLPLWFGNQDHANEENPIYGTSRVLLAGAAGFLQPSSLRRGCEYLCSTQNSDGGWGGGESFATWTGDSFGRMSSIEESAVAVEALCSIWGAERSILNSDTHGGKNAVRLAIMRGIEFLTQSISDGNHRTAWPIGFYFAKLWYHEKLYPLIFSVAALSSFLRSFDSGDAPPEKRPT